MSLPGRRLAATLLAVLPFVAGVNVQAITPPDSTWVALPALPEQGHSAIFALAVDPINSQVVLAGNSQGSLLRSFDGGLTWTSVHRGRVAVTTIAFSPLTPELVLAGTHGGGALISKDGGNKWADVSGLDGRTVRVFGYALSVFAAGTDRGVYVSPDGVSWKQSGLANVSINALAVAAIHAPVHLVVGSDSSAGAAGPTLYRSSDAGVTWTSVTPAVSGSVVARLVAGPLAPGGNIRPLVVGTNAGLFISTDDGVSYTPLSGGNLLPSTDYTQVAFVTNHYNRFYAASDGGGSRAGGLWSTADEGRDFKSMIPPLPSVTALAVSFDEGPMLYVATFRSSDHQPALWVYHDTGGSPKGPFTPVTPPASGTRGGKNGNPWMNSDLGRLLSSPQTPYVAIGGIAVLVILLAMVSNLRARRR